jgi:hypothetical protein
LQLRVSKWEVPNPEPEVTWRSSLFCCEQCGVLYLEIYRNGHHNDDGGCRYEDYKPEFIFYKLVLILYVMCH